MPYPGKSVSPLSAHLLPCVFTDCRILPGHCNVIFQIDWSIGDASSGGSFKQNDVTAGNTDDKSGLFPDGHYIVLTLKSGIVTGELRAAGPHASQSVETTGLHIQGLDCLPTRR